MADASTRCLTWAAQCLETSEDASPDELRRAFWAQLEQEEFLPPADLRAAFDYFHAVANGHSPTRLPDEFREMEEIEIGPKVEEFAAGMFDLPPAERRKRWALLRSRCDQTKRPLARCDSLKRGLDVDLSRLDPEEKDVLRLAGSLCELVAAAPHERGPHRQRIRDLWPEDPGKVGRVARRLRSSHPQIAALDPLLIQELVTPPEERRLWTRKVQQEATDIAGRLGAMALFVCALFIGGLFVSFVIVAGTENSKRRGNPIPYDVDARMREFRNQKLKEDLKIEAGLRVMEELRKRREEIQDPHERLEEIENRYEELREIGIMPKDEDLERGLKELRDDLENEPAETTAAAGADDGETPAAPSPTPGNDP